MLAALAASVAPSPARAAASDAARRAHAVEELRSLQRKLDLAVQRYDRAEADRQAIDRLAAQAARRWVTGAGPVGPRALLTPGPAVLGERAASLEAAQSDSWVAIGRAMGLRLRIIDLIARERRVLASLPRPVRLSFLTPGSGAARADARTVLHRLTASGVLRGRSLGVRAARTALSAVGVPYVWGGESPSGFDCSGLVQWAYGRLGITLPRVAADQFHAGRPVRSSALAPGDLVFFESGIGHVAMYLGDGLIVEAPHPGAVVWVTELGDDWHRSEYQGAIRP